MQPKHFYTLTLRPSGKTNTANPFRNISKWNILHTHSQQRTVRAWHYTHCSHTRPAPRQKKNTANPFPNISKGNILHTQSQQRGALHALLVRQPGALIKNTANPLPNISKGNRSHTWSQQMTSPRYSYRWSLRHVGNKNTANLFPNISKETNLTAYLK